MESLLAPITSFLQKLPAFHCLSLANLNQLAASCQVDYRERGSRLMVQGETVLEHVYIVHQGAVELYYENNQTVEHDILGEGGLYGGLSLLRNKGLSLRSANTLEDTFFYLIPKEAFFQVCTHHDELRAYFFNQVQTQVYERSLSELRKKRMAPSQDYEGYIMHLSVGEVIQRQVTRCAPHETLREAAVRMTANNSGYMLVTEGPQLLGIFTDRDLRREVVVGELSREAAVTELMRAPVLTVSEASPVLEALMLMLRHKVAFLPVLHEHGEVVGVLSAFELPQLRQQSPLNLIYNIARQDNPEELSAAKQRLPAVVVNLFQQGYAVEQITGFIAHINDTVLERLVQLALERLGQPPCPFAFIALGSEGRSEQTLIVDQDNGIIFADNAPDGALAWFQNLGALICTWLDEAGYSYCKGNVMATNADWCQPLSAWCRNFSRWVEETEPLAVMHSQIFFDFRAVYGDASLAVSLRQHLLKLMSGRVDIYFTMLSGHHLQKRPPLGFFRNFIVASKGDHKHQLDLKKTMNFCVDFARIYALKYGVPETNTLRRLELLFQRQILNEEDFAELKRGYNYMMGLRLHRQLDNLESADGEPGNYLNPYTLSDLDQEILKAVFKLLGRMQRKLSLLFTGSA